MSIDEYLNLTDDEIQFLVAYNYGEHVNNPHYCSAVDTKEKPDDYDIEELEDPESREIPDVTHLEKFQDLDAPQED